MGSFLKVCILATTGLLITVTLPLHAKPSVQTSVSWQLDPVHSFGLFRVQHMNAGMFWGRFNNVTGTITHHEDGSMPPKLEVHCAVESIDTGSEKLDRTMLGPKWFNGKEHEAMTFVSTSGEKIDSTHWKLKGDLTIAGVSREVEVMTELTGIGGGPQGRKIGFECTVEINRNAFGIRILRGAIGDKVRLVVGLEGDEMKTE